MALFIHESARRIDLDFPEVAVGISLSDEVRDIVARSRNALKLFEDTKRGIDGQVDFFRNEVVDPHRDRFIGGIRIGLLARAWSRPWGPSVMRGIRSAILTRPGSSWESTPD